MPTNYMIFMLQIVEIVRPVCGKEVTQGFRSPGVLPYELLLRPFTVIKIGEPFIDENKVSECQKITFDEIAENQGIVCKCFILIS